jgi:cytochrome c553
LKRGLVLLVLAALLIGPGRGVGSERTTELLQGALALKPRPEDGASLYRAYCADCHGAQAWGDPLAVVPALAGQRELYLLKQLVDFAELDRAAPEMHRLMARAQLGTPQAWRDLAAYLAGQTGNERAEHGDGTALAQGERLYREACAACHGRNGAGSDLAAVPDLRSQHYSYLVLQLRSIDTGHRYNVAEDAYEALIGLSAADMRSVADYLSRIPGRAAVSGHQISMSGAYDP